MNVATREQIKQMAADIEALKKEVAETKESLAYLHGHIGSPNKPKILSLKKANA